MKLQLDTTAKTIKIEDSVKLDELFRTLEVILPNEQWREFTLEVAIITHWTAPVLIHSPLIWPSPQPYIQPPNPWQMPQPWYTTCGDKTNLNDGIYNVEIKS